MKRPEGRTFGRVTVAAAAAAVLAACGGTTEADLDKGAQSDGGRASGGGMGTRMGSMSAGAGGSFAALHDGGVVDPQVGGGAGGHGGAAEQDPTARWGTELGKDIGEVCVTSDHLRSDFSGYSHEETAVETNTLECASGTCLVSGFRGRVDCPYGQPPDPSDPRSVDSEWASPCRTPDGRLVEVPVMPQFIDRGPLDAVYCSCRCDGPSGAGPFCQCPAGFDCIELFYDVGLGIDDVTGSYCLREGTHLQNPNALASGAECDITTMSCGPVQP